jgi:hypothetical protein
MRTGGMALILNPLAVLACPAADIPKPMSGTSVHGFAGVMFNDKKAEIQAMAKWLKF